MPADLSNALAWWWQLLCRHARTRSRCCKTPDWFIWTDWTYGKHQSRKEKSLGNVQNVKTWECMPRLSSDNLSGKKHVAVYPWPLGTIFCPQSVMHILNLSWWPPALWLLHWMSYSHQRTQVRQQIEEQNIQNAITIACIRTPDKKGNASDLMEYRG